ncbi:hypothetical protein RCL_jg14910.t1 [Rhizophagus clarus]|uniref:Helicase ATP-binding domain-containing protein n=1 Tax=Rhizophagus clarus TaxID=94130 RepID=A0A8H3R446_9GLOM|nr:hypothetical protein RCL_jg14910.t1 [Rhizophagus clarus]
MSIPDLNQISIRVDGFSNLREWQYEVICSFLEYKDVLRTGGEYLIDVHANSLVRIGIPTAGLYAYDNHLNIKNVDSICYYLIIDEIHRILYYNCIGNLKKTF